MNNYDDNFFTILKSNLQLPIGHKKLIKFQSLMDFYFLEDEAREKVSIKKNFVWNEEPTFKAVRKNNFKWFCFLIVLGGKLREDDFKYLVSKIEDESDKFAEKTYLIKFLSKIRDQYDQTLLHHAAQSGKLKCLKILIGCKSNENERKTDEEQTSCLFSSQNNETKCAKTSFENNVPVNVYNVQRKTPLHFAAEKGHQECLKLLIMKGGNVNAKDEDDLTPLHLAAFTRKVDYLEALLANGADVNARDNKQYTPLHIIGLSSKGSKEEKDICAELLIKAGAVIDAKDEDGDTIFAYQFFQDFKVERPDLFVQN
jgi:ankyrin repeat protein